jgi:hypothetical protein
MRYVQGPYQSDRESKNELDKPNVTEPSQNLEVGPSTSNSEISRNKQTFKRTSNSDSFIQASKNDLKTMLPDISQLFIVKL